MHVLHLLQYDTIMLNDIITVMYIHVIFVNGEQSYHFWAGFEWRRQPPESAFDNPRSLTLQEVAYHAVSIFPTLLLPHVH